MKIYVLSGLVGHNTVLIYRKSLPWSSGCIIILSNSHPLQGKTNLPSATSKHCCTVSLQPWLREMFWSLRAKEEGMFCFIWLRDLGQATVLDVSVNLNWITKRVWLSANIQLWQPCSQCWWLHQCDQWIERVFSTAKSHRVSLHSMQRG